ncbi:MAG: hypothetical protein IKC01_01320 [Clostridia bacterium]|nr:hypothetical protein [Clostridia bacterium]
MKKNSNLMDRVVFLNEVFVIWQLFFVVTSIVFNLVLDDSAVFVMLLVHTVFYIVYNVSTSTLAESKYISKEYQNVTEKVSGWRHIKRMSVLYKNASEKTDKLTTTFIKQKVIKLAAWFVNLFSVLYMVEFSY